MWKFVEKTYYTYVLFEEVIEASETKVYGIRITDGQSSVEAKDISNDYNTVLKLFNLITDGELFPEHLSDVVEDYVS